MADSIVPVLDLENYRFKDGMDASAAEFNRRFFGLVKRIYALEQFSPEWRDALSAMQNFGLATIHSTVQPLIDKATTDFEAQLASWQAAVEAIESVAQDWAEKAEDSPVLTGPDRFSALHWAAKAQASKEALELLITFATLNSGGHVGTGSNQLAVGNHNHEALPSVPRNHIDGLTVSRDTGNDPDTDIIVVPGECRDSTNSRTMRLTTSRSKQLDNIWVAGNEVGGRPTAVSWVANQWVHVFLIGKPESNGTITVDVGIDTSPTAANLRAQATGYTLYRRIRSVRTKTATATLQPDKQWGDWIWWDWDSSVLEVTDTVSDTSATELTLSYVPPDISVLGHFQWGLYSGITDGNTPNAMINIKPKGISTLSPTTYGEPHRTGGAAFTCNATSADNRQYIQGTSLIMTGSDAKVEYWFYGNGTSPYLRLGTLGYVDFRGKDGL